MKALIHVDVYLGGAGLEVSFISVLGIVKVSAILFISKILYIFFRYPTKSEVTVPT